MVRKEPNRMPFPREQAVYGGCGHRCDLCQHYIGGPNSEAFRAMLIEHVRRVYGGNPDEAVPTCLGCDHGGLDGKFNCYQMKCAAKQGIDKCVGCPNHPCEKAHAGLPPEIHTRTITADNVTWAILPYVHEQYGN